MTRHLVFISLILSGLLCHLNGKTDPYGITASLMDSKEGSTNKRSFTVAIITDYYSHDYDMDWSYNGTFTSDILSFIKSIQTANEVSIFGQLRDDYNFSCNDMEKPNPIPTMTICEKDEVTITPTGGGLNGALDGYRFYTDTTENPVFEGLSYNFEPSNSTRLFVSAYTIDQNCESDYSEFSINVKDLPEISGTVTNESCQGLNDGSISLTVVANDPDYFWRGPQNYSSIEKDIFGLADGSYVVNVTDDNNCVQEEFFTVMQGVEDFQNPVAVCNQSVEVTLGLDSLARVFWPTFNDNSYDNCKINRIEVRRKVREFDCEPTTFFFKEYVDFCYADIDRNPVIVEMRVTDNGGRQAMCDINVNVNTKKLLTQLEVFPAKEEYCSSDVITLDASNSIALDCNSEGIDQYEFFYSYDNTTWNALPNPSPQSETEVTLSSLEPRLTLFFRCVITDSCGNEEFVDEATTNVGIESFDFQIGSACKSNPPDSLSSILGVFGLSGGSFLSNPYVDIRSDATFAFTDMASTTPFFISYISANSCRYDSTFQVQTVNPPSPELSFRDTSFCLGSEVVIELLNPESFLNNINWRFSGITLSGNPQSLSEYAAITDRFYKGYVDLMYDSELECSVQDSFSLFMASAFDFEIQAIDSCQESLFTIDRPIENAEYTWNSDSQLDILGPQKGNIVRTSGQGLLRATIDNGCEVQKEVSVNTVNSSIVVPGNFPDLEIVERLCNGSVLYVFAEEHCGLRWGYDDYEDEETIFPITNNGQVYQEGYLEVPEELLESRTYFLEVTQCGIGCSAEFVEFRSSSEELYNCQKDKSKLTLYPNPTLDKVYFDINESMSYRVIDVWGRQMQEGTTEGYIDVSGFASATYILQIFDSSGRIILLEKIIKI